MKVIDKDEIYKKFEGLSKEEETLISKETKNKSLFRFGPGGSLVSFF